MKSKNKLSQLKVSSFVTSLENSSEQTVKGGKGEELTKLTVVTRGLWSYCCATFTEN
ncbi:MAG: pinensin family lanthipeptide [Cyclobacteriaceae bacterium]